MEKEFVPPQESLELKKLGFDENVFGYHTTDKEYPFVLDVRNLKEKYKEEIKAPTFSQAFKFFREKFRLHSFIDIYPTNDEPDRCWYMIRHYDRSVGDDKDIVSGFFVNQEKAELGCLIRLINIVKEQK